MIKKIYPKSFKLATPDEIASAIEKQDENALILNCALTSGWFHYYVSEAKGGKIVYADWFKPNYVEHNIVYMLKELAK